MIRVVTLANRKGGSGKTTITVNLSAELGKRNFKILIADLDPQCHASFISGINTYERTKGLGAVFNGLASIDEIVKRSPSGYFDILPLYHVESNLNSETGFSQKKNEFKEFFASYDFVLIDTPPSREDLQYLALSVSTDVIIPLQLRFLAMEGMAQLIRMIYQENQNGNAGLKLSGIIPVMYDLRSKHEKMVLDELRETFGEKMLLSGIRTDIKIADAAWKQQPIQVFNPKAKSSADFEKLADEFLSSTINPTEI